MGYYTDYELCIEPIDELSVSDALGCVRLDELASALEDIGFEGYGTNWYMNAKWYDHEEDMCSISVEYPELRFCLYGKGEEFDDIWVDYIQRGCIQNGVGRLEYDEFDPGMMRTVVDCEYDGVDKSIFEDISGLDDVLSKGVKLLE